MRHPRKYPLDTYWTIPLGRLNGETLLFRTTSTRNNNAKYYSKDITHISPQISDANTLWTNVIMRTMCMWRTKQYCNCVGPTDTDKDGVCPRPCKKSGVRFFMGGCAGLVSSLLWCSRLKLFFLMGVKQNSLFGYLFVQRRLLWKQWSEGGIVQEGIRPRIFVSGISVVSHKHTNTYQWKEVHQIWLRTIVPSQTSTLWLPSTY